jgi:hypothetical protein
MRKVRYIQTHPNTNWNVWLVEWESADLVWESADNRYHLLDANSNKVLMSITTLKHVFTEPTHYWSFTPEQMTNIARALAKFNGRKNVMTFNDQTGVLY